jgi:sugar/nucleoside kinase (ribokinase family)
MNILCVGTLAIDTVETPVGKRERVLGGSASYFSYAASLFAPVRLVGRIGSDWPTEYTRILTEHGVDWRGVKHDSQAKSYFWHGRYHADYQDRDTLKIEMHGFDRYEPRVPGDFRESDIVFLAAAIPTVQKKLLDQCHSPKLVFADTVDMWIESTREELLDLLWRLDGLFINDSEARQLTGLSSSLQAAHAIRNLGPAWVILKKGEHGCLILGPNTTLALPAVPTVALVDPTGAGDSFAGGMLGYLASRYATLSDSTLADDSASSHSRELRLSIDPADMAQAMKFGTAVASFTIGGFSLDGLRAINHKQLADRVQEIERLVGCQPPNLISEAPN